MIFQPMKRYSAHPDETTRCGPPNGITLVLYTGEWMEVDFDIKVVFVIGGNVEVEVGTMKEIQIRGILEDGRRCVLCSDDLNCFSSNNDVVRIVDKINVLGVSCGSADVTIEYLGAEAAIVSVNCVSKEGEENDFSNRRYPYSTK